MFYVYLTNFGFELEPRFTTFDEAFAYGKSKGFEFVVYNEDTPVGAAAGPGLHKEVLTLG
jgi:hypothetical protein